MLNFRNEAGGRRERDIDLLIMKNLFCNVSVDQDKNKLLGSRVDVEREIIFMFCWTFLENTDLGALPQDKIYFQIMYL